MAAVQQVYISCDCYHRHGLLYSLNPLTWFFPCEQCRRMRARNVVLVPTSGAAVAVNTRYMSSPSPVMVTTTTQSMPPQYQPQVTTVTPAQTTADWQATQQAYPSTLPPKYDMIAAK